MHFFLKQSILFHLNVLNALNKELVKIIWFSIVEKLGMKYSLIYNYHPFRNYLSTILVAYQFDSTVFLMSSYEDQTVKKGLGN